MMIIGSSLSVAVIASFIAALSGPALLDSLYCGIAAAHDLDLLVHHGADDLIDSRVQSSEFCVEVRYLVRRGAQGHADLQIGGLLIEGIGVHLVPGVGGGPGADLFDAVDQGYLESKALLRRADVRCISVH